MNEAQLNDYVDGLLSPEEAAAVERELALDSEAREKVAFLRMLSQEAQQLPKSIVPKGDLWRDISAQLDDLVVEAPRTFWQRPFWLAAAVVCLMVLSSVGGIYMAEW